MRTRRRVTPPDPRIAPTQIATTVPWFYREHLLDLSERTGLSVSYMLRGALEEKYPPPMSPVPEPEAQRSWAE